MYFFVASERLRNVYTDSLSNCNPSTAGVFMASLFGVNNQFDIAKRTPHTVRDLRRGRKMQFF
jgi:hypothetical protein